MEVSELRVMGRVTQGVRLIKLNDGDEISSVARIPKMACESNNKVEDNK
jgi:DNA gyrase subunit A